MAAKKSSSTGDSGSGNPSQGGTSGGGGNPRPTGSAGSSNNGMGMVLDAMGRQVRRLRDRSNTLRRISASVRGRQVSTEAYGLVGTGISQDTNTRIAGIADTTQRAGDAADDTAAALQASSETTSQIDTENAQRLRDLTLDSQSSGGPGKRPRDPDDDGGDSKRPHLDAGPSQQSGSSGQSRPLGPNDLIDYGRNWHSQSWIGTENPNQAGTSANQNLQNIKDHLAEHGLGAQRSPFVQHDPLIRNDGQLTTYAQLSSSLARQPDGGAGAARQLSEWIDGERGFEDLPQNLRDFAAITHFAETARGYSSDVDDLGHNLDAIGRMDPQDAAAEWRRIKEWFPPAMTREEDMNTEWTPKPRPADR
jgi:hypothetical protein